MSCNKAVRKTTTPLRDATNQNSNSLFEQARQYYKHMHDSATPTPIKTLEPAIKMFEEPECADFSITVSEQSTTRRPKSQRLSGRPKKTSITKVTSPIKTQQVFQTQTGSSNYEGIKSMDEFANMLLQKHQQAHDQKTSLFQRSSSSQQKVSTIQATVPKKTHENSPDVVPLKKTR